jgi:hypothetical protein
MALISARFISLPLTALAAGVVLGHVMSRAGMITLPGPLFVTVQNTLYRNWGKRVGAVGIGAFLSTLVLTFLTRGRGAIFALSLACLSCRDAACMGRFHQSHQPPSAGIDIRILSG